MIDTLKLVPAPGDGVLGRFQGVIVLALPSRYEAPRVGVLLDVCREVSESGPLPGEALIRRLASQFSSGQGLPPFGALAVAEGGVLVVAHGALDVAVIADGRELLVSGRHSLSWVERVVQGQISAVRAGPSLELPDDGALGRGPGLTGGVVPASGFVLVDEVAPSADPPRPPLPIGESDEFHSVLLTEVSAAVSREPLPIASELSVAERAPGTVVIKGVQCARGHFTDPDNYYCAVCGISMAQRTKVLVDGPRPPLGFLVFDDGSIYALDGDYVVGREPHDDAGVAGGARPLPLDDAERTVSRVHADIHLDGWHVRITDRASTNGTFQWDEAGGRWRRLDPDDSIRIQPGARVAFGHRSCVFESPHGHRG